MKNLYSGLSVIIRDMVILKPTTSTQTLLFAVLSAIQLSTASLAMTSCLIDNIFKNNQQRL
jgi:hypothetical protein